MSRRSEFGRLHNRSSDGWFRPWRLTLVAGLLIVLLAPSCQRSQQVSIVGAWRNWDHTMLVTFTGDGHVAYEIDYTSEDHWTVIQGTYEVLSQEILALEIEHEWSGELRYALSDDVHQLDDAAGRRIVFNRQKMGAP